MGVLDTVLGSGVEFPIGFDTGRLKTSDGVHSVVSAILMLFATRRGTRFFMPEYGSRLNDLVFEQCTDITGQVATIYAREEILEWIPRVRSITVDFTLDNEQSLVYLQINFSLQNSATEVMMTYPFYLQSNTYRERTIKPNYAILNQ